MAEWETDISLCPKQNQNLSMASYNTGRKNLVCTRAFEAFMIRALATSLSSFLITLSLSLLSQTGLIAWRTCQACPRGWCSCSSLPPRYPYGPSSFSSCLCASHLCRPFNAIRQQMLRFFHRVCVCVCVCDRKTTLLLAT